MDDHERRKYLRDDQFAGEPLEAVIEEGNGFISMVGAVLINHSDGGMQIVADMSPNLAMGKLVIVYLNDGLSLKKNRVETIIVWMSENDGKARLGCEFTYPIMGIHF
jgi:hypothetical protein